MKNRIILFILLLFIVCHKGNGQQKNEMIDEIIKSRSNYFVDSIPEKYKQYYKWLTPSVNKPFYDTLRSILLRVPFPVSNFFWIEYITDDLSYKFAEICIGSFVVCLNCRFIPKWDRLPTLKDSIIYEFEVRNNLKNTLTESFIRDFEEWNEFVTNRSYLHSPLLGGCFIFGSKICYDDGNIEMVHTVFKEYRKKKFFYWLKEQPKDGYKRRIRLDCKVLEKINEPEFDLEKGFAEECKERGWKVFDCDGNEL